MVGIVCGLAASPGRDSFLQLMAGLDGVSIEKLLGLAA